MAINKVVDGLNTTVEFSYTAETTKITNWLEDAAKQLYGKVPGTTIVLEEGETVEDLTNGEFGIILDEYVKWSLKQQAKAYYVNINQVAARETAETEVGTRYE